MVAEQEYGADEKEMRELFGGGASAAASRIGVRPISVERHKYEPHMAVSWLTYYKHLPNHKTRTIFIIHVLHFQSC